MKPLTPEAITDLCRRHPGWHLLQNELVRTYEFPDFAAAIAFVNRVAELAERAGHHPDLDIRYNKVKLALITHDAGGISTRDAGFISELAKW